MRRSVRRAAALIAVLLAGAFPAAAGLDDRPEEELRRTDELVAKAREVVEESDSRRARDVVEAAARLQEGAWSQLRSGRPALALRLTREARDTALRAISVAREDASLKNRARLELERAQAALDRAREALEGTPGDHPARRMLEESRGQIERGRVQYHEQHYQAALRLALSAQTLIRGAIGSVSDAGADRARREVERTEAQIRRVQPIVRESGEGEALRLLERAIDLQSRARASLQEGALRRALAETKEARRFADRAGSRARGPMDSGAIMRAVQETDRILERASDAVRDARNESAVRLLEKAKEHQARAKLMLDEAKNRPALAETRVARTLAKRAIRMAQEGDA